MERYPALDGLRGIAVILVIALHTFKRAAEFTAHPVLHFIADLTSVGWVGVDIFFVLSGFLITSILLRTKTGAGYFKNFYVRRILRIFPLYYIGLAVLLALMPVLDPDYAPWIKSDLPYLLLYQQNWLSIYGFAGHGLTVFLSVTWSLAIEEQFYLLWPAVVYFSSEKNLLRISVGIMLFSLLSRVGLLLLWGDVNRAGNFFFFGTFTRFEELVVGGVLALLLTWPAWKERIRRYAGALFWTSLAVFFLLCSRSFPSTPHPAYENVPLIVGSYTSAALFSAGLIGVLVTIPERSWVSRLFGNAVLTQWGKYSYSAYLFHVPIAVILLDEFSHAFLKGWQAYTGYILLTYGLTFLLALATWYLIEKHFLDLKKHFDYRPRST
jgi:peptidoglycan/LPS O-acetylase OafA/YrhL